MVFIGDVYSDDDDGTSAAGHNGLGGLDRSSGISASATTRMIRRKVLGIDTVMAAQARL